MPDQAFILRANAALALSDGFSVFASCDLSCYFYPLLVADEAPRTA